jgi:hypothetical protein
MRLMDYNASNTAHTEHLSVNGDYYLMARYSIYVLGGPKTGLS